MVVLSGDYTCMEAVKHAHGVYRTSFLVASMEDSRGWLEVYSGRQLGFELGKKYGIVVQEKEV